MYRKDYYYIVAGLPELSMDGEKKGLNSLQFRQNMNSRLTESDFKLLQFIYLQYDNKNLLSVLLNRPQKFDKMGNYSQDFLTAQTENPTSIFSYLKQFILDFKADEFENSDLKAENRLWESYYDFILKSNNEFIKQWFNFDRDIKNIQTAINCRNYNYNLEEQLIPDNTGLYESLLNEIPSVELFEEEDLPYREQIFQIANSSLDMNEKEMKIDLIKWSYLDEITFFYYFTIEKILSFAIKLAMVDRWRKLDHTSGKALWERLVYDLEMSYYFADEFSLNQKK